MCQCRKDNFQFLTKAYVRFMFCFFNPRRLMTVWIVQRAIFGWLLRLRLIYFHITRFQLKCNHISSFIFPNKSMINFNSFSQFCITTAKSHFLGSYGRLKWGSCLIIKVPAHETELNFIPKVCASPREINSNFPCNFNKCESAADECLGDALAGSWKCVIK